MGRYAHLLLTLLLSCLAILSEGESWPYLGSLFFVARSNEVTHLENSHFFSFKNCIILAMVDVKLMHARMDDGAVQPGREWM